MDIEHYPKVFGTLNRHVNLMYKHYLAVEQQHATNEAYHKPGELPKGDSGAYTPCLGGYRPKSYALEVPRSKSVNEVLLWAFARSNGHG